MNSVLKKFLNILLLSLILFLCVGLVSATDNSTGDSYSINEDSTDSSFDVEKMSVSEENLLESTIKPSGNTVTDIQKSISNAKKK